jgi:hypothetical protein
MQAAVVEDRADATVRVLAPEARLAVFAVAWESPGMGALALGQAVGEHGARTSLSLQWP